MKHLIIYMHPTEDSFNGAILNTYSRTLEEAGHDIVVRNLYKETFAPLLSMVEYNESLEGNYQNDVIQEQNHILDADFITFIFPFWWGGFPAIGKGYIDRVFSYGVAYELEGEDPIPLLTGKKAVMIFTTGTPEPQFIDENIKDNFLGLVDKSIFEFCGLQKAGVLHFGDVIQSSDKQRKEMLQKVETFAKGLI